MAADLRVAPLGDHIDRLYRAAWALCGERADAEDLVQETFANVLAKQREIDSDDPLPYLLGVLRNQFVSDLRTRARRPAPVELDDAAIERVAACAARGPVAQTEPREVFAAIAALRPEWRDVLVSVDVAGFAYREAADALGLPLGTVRAACTARGRR